MTIAHGTGARVGEQIDVDVFRLKEEGVVARFLDGPRRSSQGSLMRGRLHHLDLPGLSPGTTAPLLTGCCQGSLPTCPPPFPTPRSTTPRASARRHSVPCPRLTAHHPAVFAQASTTRTAHTASLPYNQSECQPAGRTRGREASERSSKTKTRGRTSSSPVHHARK